MSKVEIENVVRVWTPGGSRYEIDQDPEVPGVRLQYFDSQGKSTGLGHMFFTTTEAMAVADALRKIASEIANQKEGEKLSTLIRDFDRR